MGAAGMWTYVPAYRGWRIILDDSAGMSQHLSPYTAASAVHAIENVHCLQVDCLGSLNECVNECRAHRPFVSSHKKFPQLSDPRRHQSYKTTKSGKSSLATQSNKRRPITCHRPAQRSLHTCLSCHEASSTSPTMPKRAVLRFPNSRMFCTNDFL